MEIIIKATETTLSNYNKTSTPPTIYKQLYQSIKNILPNHNFLYTDSATNETYFIKSGLCPHYSSVLFTELIAIHEAVKIATISHISPNQTRSTHNTHTPTPIGTRQNQNCSLHR